MTCRGACRVVKITFVIAVASLAGGNRVVATYARLLKARGHEVTVVSRPWPRRTLLNRLRRALRGQPIRPHPSSPLFEALGDRHRVLDRRRPVAAADVPDGDAVVATWWETAEWVAALPVSKGRKFYLLQDVELFDHLPVDRVRATYALPLHKLAVSGYIRDRVRKEQPGAEIGLLPNAVDHALFTAPPRHRGRPFTVGFLYSSAPRKRAELAFATVEAARVRLPDLQVLAFGSKGDPSEIPPGIVYRRAPPQQEIPKLYAACDLWLFTSAHEGFGLPLLEAMACRTPVLATRAGAAPDLIDGRNGRLLPPDPEAFSAEIETISRMDPAEWRAMSDAAHATAAAHSWEAATDRLLGYLGEEARS
ncbi:glycosyltransferase family 4 protein [Rhodovulum sulfidophilum]|uniref:Glycosyltransferase family 4 protein n=1 Tax=Rhodovulum sulfidophilum TaxID=35806 RepID=A0ABS1RW28_RHOSU|nr:glycosyltransferase family 4 protein [Rhodovulum sulfidophilum]MBL3610285.1 glycosyltransferase family 4 protein [Rhodovulum sulfidophilum]